MSRQVGNRKVSCHRTFDRCPFQCLGVGASVCEKHCYSCLFIQVKTYVHYVLNRPLAMLRQQRITTRVALGSSSSSTIWRAVSSEGTSSCFTFISLSLSSESPRPLQHSWFIYQYFTSYVIMVVLATTARLRRLCWHSLLLRLLQGSYREVPSGEVPPGVQRSQGEVYLKHRKHSRFTLYFLTSLILPPNCTCTLNLLT